MHRQPMYRVINEDLAAQIQGGVFSSGDQLPNEHDLAKQYGVSRMTVRQALNLLEEDGLVARRHGIGTFVSEKSRRGRRLNRLRSFSEELGSAPDNITSDVVRAELVYPPKDVAEALELASDDSVSRLTRVRRVNKEPAALQDAWIPYSVAPGIVREPLIDNSLYRTLAERHGVALRWADQSMTASLLGKEEARSLGIEPGGAVLHGLRTTYSTENRPVEYTRGWTLPEFPLLLRIEAE
ncbi:GntR family transcriptional regulator [Brevibacterium sp. SMBL_HHYL_HB1]|uniref:GntR family transcriptional regulator n=1 Tax=Brevibacterium sp. SMBL_HHYL_HB1 TaxID=2777556 RepID=UPI001BACED6C|nr:GntR family transcriptional regulator [Brevibacterium sp. SMBL_HHYL_HB1]QUL78544.1 GntR family transcriptional regulator [Brevibacterium sp. SMBL_HHYL_HB1]